MIDITNNEENIMKRHRPDIMLVLAIFIGLGVIITGFAQEFDNMNQALVVSIFQK